LENSYSEKSLEGNTLHNFLIFKERDFLFKYISSGEKIIYFS